MFASSSRFASQIVMKHMNGAPRSILNQARHMGKERASKGIKPGVALVIDGQLVRVVKYNQGKRGKGGGFVRATLKGIDTNSVYEKTFTSDEIVEVAELERSHAKYSWNEGDVYVFLNDDTFEEIRINKEDLINPEFLSEGMAVKTTKFQERYIGADMPVIGEYEVVSVDSTRMMGDYYEAVLSCGAKVSVPPFVKEGTRVRVNIEEGKYVERA